MSKIKNTSGESLLVPWLGGRLVLAGAEVEVPAGDVFAYTQQEHTWAPADAEATEIHDGVLSDLAELIDAEQTQTAESAGTLEPAGNASREEWATYVLTAGLATDDEIADLNRDQLRDTYKSTEG